MDRYQITAGEHLPPEEPPPPPPERPGIPRFKLPKNVRNVVKVESAWEGLYTIVLEVSPRGSTCAKCRGTIPKQTGRYRVIYGGSHYPTTTLYHRKCLPKKYRELFRNYLNTDHERVAAEHCLDAMALQMRNLARSPYREEFLKKMYKMVDDFDPRKVPDREESPW